MASGVFDIELHDGDIGPSDEESSYDLEEVRQRLCNI